LKIPRSRNPQHSNYLWFLPAVLLVGSILVPASAVSQKEGPQAQRPSSGQRLPLDPLTPEERAYAERVARADGRIKEILGETGVRLVSIEVAAIKPESLSDAERMARHVEVILFRPEDQVGVKVLVNLQQKSVVQVQKLNGAQVPLTADDLREAFELAQRHNEVEKMLGPSARSFQMQPPGARIAVPLENEVTGLRVRGKNEEDPCTRHRCIELFFRRGSNYLSEQSVVVDLTEKKVYVERMSHETH
jgi:hypothetical protein